jgi:peroxiredoxin
LADFQSHLEALRAEEISVLALSTDSLEKARETVEQDKIGFPVAYGLRIPDDADRIGAPFEPKRSVIQPSEFILGPDRRVIHATYSTGPIGRIRAEEALSMIGFVKARLASR